MSKLLQQPVDLKRRKVLVVGAARSGVAAANLVLRLGGYPKLTEAKPLASVEPDVADLSDGVVTEFGGHTPAFVEDSDLVILSPGVRKDSLPAQWAMARGIPVIGEVELAFRFCPSPIVAVTGSNGKTTTVTLIAEIIKAAGRKVCLCGNIGSAFSGQVMSLTPDTIVVLEISSFQLETTVSFKPHVAVILNFSQNHLDRHKDLKEYFDAKAMIFANQDEHDVAVLNARTPELKAIAPRLRAQVRFFNAPETIRDITNPNYLAAMEVARVLGIGEDVCRKVFAEFKGVEHRLEWVRTLNGVDYINDSKSTTVEASRWALERTERPMIMICGGRDKNLDYTVLRDLVQKKVKLVLAIGEARDKIKNAYADVTAVETVATLPEAVGAARRRAQTGDSVVLTPMCASFDQFKSFEHRGRVFKELVLQLT